MRQIVFCPLALSAWQIILIIVGILAFLGIFWLILFGEVLYHILLVRTTKKKWQRGPSMDDAKYMRLYKMGEAWREEHLSYIRQVTVKSGKLTLAAEYYDFGHDKCVIILPGRMETAWYCAFFAEPYMKAGWNVLAADPRAHGLSEGRYDTLGFRECRDVIAWAKYLHDELGMKKIFLHGVCIGSETACFTLAEPDCPEYITGMCGEGMFKNFYATFVTHLEEKGHKPFPSGIMGMFFLWFHTGVDVFHDGPEKRLPLVKKPVLMLHSREDIYSLPEIAEKLYASATAEKKEMVWFDTGFHSMIRSWTPENREKYDRVIAEFLNEI